MPDDASSSAHVSFRVPGDILDAIDKVAAALDRPRSWVMARALKQYLENEGAEAIDVAAGVAEAERGETVDLDETVTALRERFARAGPARR